MLFWEYVGDNDDTIETLKNYIIQEYKKSDIFLVIDDTYEGLLTQVQIDDLILFCKNLGEINYIIYSSNEKLNGDNLFFFSFHLCYNNFDNIDVQNQDFKPNLYPRHKLFLSLNRQTRFHRLELVDYLIQQELLQHSFVSCAKTYFDNLVKYDYKDISSQKKKEFEIKSYFDNDIINYTLSKESIQRLSASLPLVLDVDPDSNDVLHSKHLPSAEMFFQNSYWSLIGERDFYNDDYRGWTEKVLKSFFYCHPFIVIGLPNTLKSLQKMGFITFSSVIDESYDSVEDPKERFQKIKEQINYLAGLNYIEHYKIYRKILPILNYNRNHYLFLNKNYQPTTFINRLFEWYCQPDKAIQNR